MNKLEERFEDIIYDNVGNTIFNLADDALKAAIVCAKEAKKIAFAFGEYFNNYDVWDDTEAGLIYTNYGKPKETIEQIFDRFLEEYYDKITDK